MTQESGPVPGWQEAYFAAPIPISANQTYVAAYYAPSGQYADGYYGLTQLAVIVATTEPSGASLPMLGVDGLKLRVRYGAAAAGVNTTSTK